MNPTNNLNNLCCGSCMKRCVSTLICSAAAIAVLVDPVVAFSTTALPPHLTIRRPFSVGARLRALPALRGGAVLARNIARHVPRMAGESATTKMLTAEEIHDRQWELNRLNFRAQWECDMSWYARSPDVSTTNQDLWLHNPSEIKKDVSSSYSVFMHACTPAYC